MWTKGHVPELRTGGIRDFLGILNVAAEAHDRLLRLQVHEPRVLRGVRLCTTGWIGELAWQRLSARGRAGRRGLRAARALRARTRCPAAPTPIHPLAADMPRAATHRITGGREELGAIGHELEGRDVAVVMDERAYTPQPAGRRRVPDLHRVCHPAREDDVPRGVHRDALRPVCFRTVHAAVLGSVHHADHVVLAAVADAVAVGAPVDAVDLGGACSVRELEVLDLLWLV